MNRISRRAVLGGAVLSAAGSTLGFALDSVTEGETRDARPRMKVIVAGAHPDDPESAAGGTMAMLADAGHDVVALYLTRGEAGIRGKMHEQAAAIRTAEAIKACQILKAQPIFAGQIDGSTEITADRYDHFRKLLLDEKPDLVITHWPVDTHRDHRATSLLTYDAWLKAGKSFALYYFEVSTGSQTQNFRPTHFVDITAVEPRKRQACFAHASQDPADFYKLHTTMAAFRGMEHHCPLAEAFIHHDHGPRGPMP